MGADDLLAAFVAALPDELATLATLGRQVEDWSTLARLAHAHGVAGSLFDGLIRAGYTLPSRVLETQGRARAGERLHQNVLGAALERILAAVASVGERVVALKGPLLAERLYATPSHRGSADLDLLVVPESLDRVVAALGPIGYRIEAGPSGRFFRTQHHHVHLSCGQEPVLEVHYHAYRGFGTRLPARELVDRASRHDRPRWRSAWVLCPEDEFLYLAVHAASHRFERLAWLYDLKLLVRQRPELKFSLVAQRARACGLGAVLAFACERLEALGVARPWGQAIPALTRLRTRAARFLGRPRERHLMDAAARFGFETSLCGGALLAARSVAHTVEKKLRHEFPRRLTEALRSGPS